MHVIYILLAVLTIITILSVYFFLVKPYSERYRKAMIEIEEGFVDTIRATNILMRGFKQHEIDQVILDTIRRNIIVERIFRQNDILCTKENSRKWILREVSRLQEKYDI